MNKKFKQFVSVFGLAAVLFGVGHYDLNKHAGKDVNVVHVPIPDADFH